MTFCVCSPFFMTRKETEREQVFIVVNLFLMGISSRCIRGDVGLVGACMYELSFVSYPASFRV